jgi:hypothetical protein
VNGNSEIDEEMIELMIDNQTVEFVNRDKDDCISDVIEIINLSNCSDKVEHYQLTDEERKLRNKRFRDKMRAKLKKEKEDCAKLGIKCDKRRLSKGKKWKRRGIERRLKGLPVGPCKRLNA